MRRIHSVVINLALTEPLLISEFENASGTRMPDELRRSTETEPFMRMLSHYGIRSQSGANQNECDAARGCDA